MNGTLVNKNICNFIDEMMNELNTVFNETFKLLNTENKGIINYPNIELVRGNIPIIPELLNKYKSVSEIFECEKDFLYVINLSDNIKFKYENISISDAKSIAISLFESNNFSNKILWNDFNIIVSKAGIRESIEKIFYNNQKYYLVEHFIILKNLDLVIKNMVLVNQGIENKNREKYNSWNYYISKVCVNGQLFILEIEIVSMLNGENHYRVQRLKC